MNWLHYLLEANLYLGVFYAVYYLFLSNDTHYALNRIYLLAISVISFIIPLIQLGFLKSAEPQVISVTLIPPPHVTLIHNNIAPAETISFSWQDGLVLAYLLGVVVLFIIFSVKIYRLFKLTRTANSEFDHNYKLIYVDDSNTAFSFFNYLFIGTKSSGTDTIIQHELVHIRQKHSVDIIFIELLKIVNWFNPFVYLLQASLKTLHEYIADEQTATNGTDVIGYSTFLVNNAYGLSGSSITHSFFNYNLLKKRIIMLNQQRSGNLARLKYLLILPIIAGLLCASTLAFSKSYGIVDLLPNKINSTLQPRYDVWNKSYDRTFTTLKGFKVHERVIFINGAVSKTAEIFDEAGQKHIYEARFISPKECKYVKDVFGYQFPVDSVIKAKLAPPPPPKPLVNASKHKLLPPPPAPKPVNVHLVPPPPPMNPDFMSLYNYLNETLSYPTNAKLKLKTGTVGVSFKLTADNKITDIKVIDAAGNGFDEEVVKVLSSFKGIVKPASKHNYYVMGITFNLLGEGSQSNIMAKNPGDDISGASNYTCIVNVYSYIK